MAPSRRRGPSGKTSATAARSAAIQAAEKRRREEQKEELQTPCDYNNSKINNNTNDGINDDKTPTAQGVHAGYDASTHLELTNNNIINNNTTTAAAHAYTELGKRSIAAGTKRKKISLFPPFAADIGASTTTSTASSCLSPTQEVVVTTTKQLLHGQPYCKVVPEDQRHKNICSNRSRHGKMVYKRRQNFYYAEGGDVVDYEDDDDEDEGCLHCHEKVKHLPRIRVIDEDEDEDENDSNGAYCGDTNIQVRCDDCRGYICNGCHWCHEFQANHEIRVCDRCDAFYCRGCDEMDQCDDCGEVVCGSCSTLLSCKFCGGGLCEECATACGRCGIVLCSRDAKFAVDCDTCRLSYCLVCLASGSKDPCVRCGHRPSKRMEQLVHLRLKSIYKAFKSSSSNSNVGGSTIDGGYGNHSNSNYTIGSHDDRNDFHGSNDKKDGHGGRSRRNKPTTLQDMVGDHDDEDGDPAMSMMMGAAAGVLPHKFCHDLEQNYLAEKKKADAAAEALLAELEEEETAIAQKKSKKKKKKDRKNASKQHIGDDEGEGEENSGDAEAKNKTTQNHTAFMIPSDEEVNADPSSETDSIDQARKVDDEVGNKLQKFEDTKMDPIEKELVEYVNDFDIEGVENILFRLKGIPGRAALRKNAKKALKRMKLELNPPPPTPPMPKLKATTKSVRNPTTAINRSSSTIGKLPPVVVDSRTSSKKTTINKSTNINEKPSSNSTKATNPKSSSRKNSGTNRCEAVVEIVSRLVGWMIGKNGQRIRDLMEESGAKIWIDQEKFKGQETRNVYISGDRKAVDQAVLLVNDVIINAPPPQGTTSDIAVAAASMANLTVSQKPVENPVETTGLISPSTVLSAQSALPGTSEVKSAWTKASGRSLEVEKVEGTVPKPPALISLSTTATVENTMEHPKAKLASGIEHIGSVESEQALGVFTGLPKIATDMATPAVDASMKSNLQHTSAEVTTEIVTCDFRFVPLLIGKRGWTIKNIQDDSGARVDIDQTVTPRQVRISGSKANVDKAVTMVRDVLSYPHAQLQSSSEGMVKDESGVLPELGTDVRLSEVQVPVSTPTKQKLLDASAILEHDGIRKTLPRQGGNSERIHSPPPVVVDAKSAISASSSLSSTPEPSMASSSKGFIASHLQNCPLLPPPSDHYIMGNSASQPLSRRFLQSEGAPIDGMDVGGLWASTGVGSGARVPVAPQASYADSTGQTNFQGGRPIVMPHGAPSQPQINYVQQQGQQLQMNTEMIHEQQHPQGNSNHHQHLIQQSFAPTGQISQRIALQANPNLLPNNRSSQFSNQNIGNNQHNLSMRSSLRDAPPYNLYSNEGVPAARAIATTPLRDLMHQTGVGGGPVVSSPTRGSGFMDSGSRLWETVNQTYPPSGLTPQTAYQPQASSGFAATSIGFSSGHHQQSNESGMANYIGYAHSQVIPSQQSFPNTNPLPVAASTAAIPSGLRNDDSRIFDSLFGGPSNVQPSNIAATNGLLSGFNGLSLPKEEDVAKPSGLWGAETWRDYNGNATSDGDNPNAPSIGNFFLKEPPNLSQVHPQESRFNWD